MADHHEHENDIVLEVEGVTKVFPGVLANDDVNLTLRQGEILALLGENGAGKSTLMNVIYGLYRPDKGSIRLKGRDVHFSSPREAIHSGIGMVHQHFQLVDVMTVAENVVLGEEADVAYQGRVGSPLAWLLKWLPSVTVFVLTVIVGASLSDWTYFLASIGIGAALGALVAVPPAARLVWGVAWRVGLAYVALAIAGRVELVTKVGLTDIALRQKVEVVDEKQPKEMPDGYTVKSALVRQDRIAFEWSREGRAADEAGTGTEGVIAVAKARLEEYRDDGVPGWLLDAIDDVPPVAGAISVAVMLVLLGWHSLVSWRGTWPSPRRLAPMDLALLVAIGGLYAYLAWRDLDTVETAARLGLLAAVIAALGWIGWRMLRRRRGWDHGEPTASSPLDSVLDSFLVLLHNITQIRNVRAAAARVHALSQQYGLEVDPDAVIEKLPVGAQQRVEIVKALYRQADILILDEPTAVLTPQEGRELFKIMRELASQGVSIIFITHKLKEVFEVATHIVVMRDGRVVGTTTPDQATETSLAAMMVGREVILQVDKEDARPAGTVLDVRDLSAFNDRGAQALNGVSFNVQAGEVLGIAGVQGNGQTELVEVLTGLREATGGSVELLGTALQPDVQPAGRFGARLAAFVIDMLLVAVLAYFIGFFVWHFNDGELNLPSAIVVLVIVDMLWFLGSWLTVGATLGMSVFGLEVVGPADSKAAPVRLAQRYAAFLALRVPLLIPWIAVLWQANHRPDAQTWIDTRLHLRLIKRERITPRRIKDTGTSHVPEDRQRYGLVKVYSVADNLVLNDFYERPYAQSPNAAEFPAALLRYVLLTGALVAAFTVIGLYIWNHAVWDMLLDVYNVPERFRELSDSMGRQQRAALQYPFLISVVVLLVSETAFGGLAHLIAGHILGVATVRSLFDELNRRLRQLVWRATGHTGEVPAPRGGLLRDQAAIDRNATGLIEEYDIRTPGSQIEGGHLSGGNQQKLIVAREFSRKPRLLIAAQPTRGIDVGSIEFIHRRIIEQRDEGAAVLLVSAELDEIMALSDRIAVLYKGEIIDTLPAEAATREQLGLLMAGIKNGGAATA